jgi:hypothetical protein
MSPETGAELRLSAIVVAFGKESLLYEYLHSLDTALDAVEGDTELIVVLNRLSAQSRLRRRPGGRFSSGARGVGSTR